MHGIDSRLAGPRASRPCGRLAAYLSRLFVTEKTTVTLLARTVSVVRPEPRRREVYDSALLGEAPGRTRTGPSLSAARTKPETSANSNYAGKGHQHSPLRISVS